MYLTDEQQSAKQNGNFSEKTVANGSRTGLIYGGVVNSYFSADARE